MKNKYRYVPLILLAAPFLMANSPAPYATVFDYTEVSISEISQTGNTITYTSTVTLSSPNTNTVYCGDSNTTFGVERYNAGWNAAIDACAAKAKTCYTGTKGTAYATQSNTAQSINVIKNYTEHTYYELASKKS